LLFLLLGVAVLLLPLVWSAAVILGCFPGGNLGREKGFPSQGSVRTSRKGGLWPPVEDWIGCIVCVLGV